MKYFKYKEINLKKIDEIITSIKIIRLDLADWKKNLILYTTTASPITSKVAILFYHR